MFVDLETQRLKLKCIDDDDADFMYKEFTTDEINQYLYDEEPMASKEEAEEWIALFSAAEPRNQHRWIIVLKENGEKVGTCGFHCWKRKESVVEIGYDLQPAYWRQGYMSEALEAMLSFAKDEMKVKKIKANISEHNIASQKTALKFGFVKSTQTYYEEFRGKKYLHYIYEKQYI